MPAPDLFNLLKKVWQKHGFTSAVTRNILNLGIQDSQTGWYAKTYAASTIQMYIITKATKFLVLKQALFIEYDGDGYTKDAVAEGDIIAEANGVQYLVLTVCDRSILSQFSYYEVGLKMLPSAVSLGVWNKWDGADGPFNRILRTLEKNGATVADRTLYRLALGAQDPATGWFFAQYILTVSIRIAIMDSSASPQYLPQGIYTTYMHVGYTLDDAVEGDVIKEAGSTHVYHRVLEVKTIQVGDHLVYNQLTLEALDAEKAQALGIP